MSFGLGTRVWGPGAGQPPCSCLNLVLRRSRAATATRGWPFVRVFIVPPGFGSFWLVWTIAGVSVARVACVRPARVPNV